MHARHKSGFPKCYNHAINDMRTPITKHPKRLHWLTAFATAGISAVGWMRFQQTLRHWFYLIDINLWPHPIYLAITGGLIGIGFSLGLILHLTANPHTNQFLRILCVILVVWLWVDRIFIGMRESFTILLASTLLITICLVLLDQLVFQKVVYKSKKADDGSEN